MSDTSSESGPLTPPPPARAVLVVGSARSGANDLARALELLGLRAPGAPVPDQGTSVASNGSSWVTDFHERLLRRVNVAPTDARPQAWFETGKLATDEEVRRELFDWLATEAGAAPSDLLVADPRLAWFLGLWKAAGLRCGVDTSYALMLRAPRDVAAGATQQASGHSETSRVAGWVNQALHAERATRGSRRAFVSHEDLLEDWTVPLYRLGERFGIESIHNATARDIRRVHDLIDSRSAGGRAASTELDVPGTLRALVDETWDQLTKLARADEEPSDVHTTLDELRRSYTELYADAERMAHSTIVAARRRRPSRRTDDSAATSSTSPEVPTRRRLRRRRPTT